MDPNNLTHFQYFLLGVLVGIGIIGLVWAYFDRKALKAKVVALETAAKKDVAAVEHGFHMVEGAGSVAKSDLAAFLAEVRAAAAKVEAAKAAAAAPAPAAPVSTPPQP